MNRGVSAHDSLVRMCCGICRSTSVCWMWTHYVEMAKHVITYFSSPCSSVIHVAYNASNATEVTDELSLSILFSYPNWGQGR